MSAPTVTAICLTKDRPEMLARAVRCFQSQTYDNKRLIIYDQSEQSEPCASTEIIHVYTRHAGRSIGQLRNDANGYTYSRGEVIVHFDDDDWSHPNRIAEQVALLQASSADCVGYSDVLFWREAEGEAWLYTAHDAGFAPGTSLAYWRRTWEAKPFPNTSSGEDYEWLRGLKLARTSSLVDNIATGDIEPMLIASIHAGNTSASYQQLLAIDCGQRDHYFRRVPEWDSVCRERMAL